MATRIKSHWSVVIVVEINCCLAHSGYTRQRGKKESLYKTNAPPCTHHYYTLVLKLHHQRLLKYGFFRSAASNKRGERKWERSVGRATGSSGGVSYTGHIYEQIQFFYLYQSVLENKRYIFHSYQLWLCPCRDYRQETFLPVVPICSVLLDPSCHSVFLRIRGRQHGLHTSAGGATPSHRRQEAQCITDQPLARRQSEQSAAHSIIEIAHKKNKKIEKDVFWDDKTLKRSLRAEQRNTFRHTVSARSMRRTQQATSLLATTTVENKKNKNTSEDSSNI
eukprot:gene8364-5855_t